jgi:hypothetical protein
MVNNLLIDLPEHEQDKWELDYYESAATVRGSVLNNATALEMSIDLYITNYFTNDTDKAEELMNLIISPRMTFENKVQVLMVLIERHNPEILEENKSLRADLKKVIEERNVLAHYPLDRTHSALQTYYQEPHSLTFFKFKNVSESDGNGEKKKTKLTNSIVYNISKTEELVTLINKYHLLFMKSLPNVTPHTTSNL